MPLSLLVTGANTNDSLVFAALLDDLPAMRTAAGRRRCRPEKVRWKAERTIAWLAGCRRLRVRYDRDAERFFAFAMLACDRLGYNRLPCAATARLP